MKIQYFDVEQKQFKSNQCYSLNVVKLCKRLIFFVTHLWEKIKQINTKKTLMRNNDRWYGVRDQPPGRRSLTLTVAIGNPINCQKTYQRGDIP